MPQKCKWNVDERSSMNYIFPLKYLIEKKSTIAIDLILGRVCDPIKTD
jgi:hypothetical protein